MQILGSRSTPGAICTFRGCFANVRRRRQWPPAMLRCCPPTAAGLAAAPVPRSPSISRYHPLPPIRPTARPRGRGPAFALRCKALAAAAAGDGAGWDLVYSSEAVREGEGPWIYSSPRARAGRRLFLFFSSGQPFPPSTPELHDHTTPWSPLCLCDFDALP
jgi:hypothetical protein